MSYGDPLQKLHIVNLQQSLIEDHQCKEGKFICVATFTVVLNESVEYSQQYLSKGVAHFSANTYENSISPSKHSLNVEVDYSVSYFEYEIDYEKQANSPFFIYVQPVSSCRPILQT